MKVRILVSFKDSVLDPQGQTVKNALHTLGYAAVKEARQGKVFELDLAGPGEHDAYRGALVSWRPGAGHLLPPNWPLSGRARSQARWRGRSGPGCSCSTHTA